ncbi:hypothetical protein DFR24_1114 [Panacagrimonas perspica]|uniref:ADYC domain-containing protein n=1 Tax=Panacagrimonas perspica TaxID=381431 RepID=A0A4S3K4P4_9GAMM|nr:ADYC domain-containing protein [Panacagrimonas perspica]TDU31735.1 hypothetical protein DFR24_1114 [Panacagrimonas perspica]THD03053.1 hypothetical protein B1810_10675 [Panacagrimonas perspica]
MVLFATATGAVSADDLVATPGLTVEGTAFVLQRPDQRPLKGVELQGMTVNVVIGGKAEAVRLVRISPDPDDTEILRHEFERRDVSGQWHSACEPNFEGETWGIPVGPGAGQASHTGAVSLTCSSGAIAKCIRYGYKPWGLGHNGENLAPYFAACVRMIRADYAGDGSPHTKPGTFIKFHDAAVRWQQEAAPSADYVFEAGWSPDGAVCVAHVRWPEYGTRETILASSPDLARRSVVCTEASAKADGALIFSASRVSPRVGR